MMLNIEFEDYEINEMKSAFDHFNTYGIFSKILPHKSFEEFVHDLTILGVLEYLKTIKSREDEIE